MWPQLGHDLDLVWWSILAVLSFLNLGVSIAGLLLTLKWRNSKATVPTRSNWQYESRPRIPPRPLRGLEAAHLKRHTILFPDPGSATYATIV